MIVQNSIHTESFFEFQYEFVNLQSGFDLTSKLYDIVTESSQKDNFIVRLKNAVVNIIKKFINFLQGLIFKEKKQSSSASNPTSSSKLQSSTNNKNNSKNDVSTHTDNPTSASTKQKLKVEQYGSDVYVVDTNFIEKELTVLFNLKDDIFKRHEKIVDRLENMSWRDDETYNDPCFEDAQKEMQNKITIKDDFLNRYDSDKIKVISNYEVSEKDYDRIHDLRLKYDKLYFDRKSNFSYQILDFYQSLQDKSKELLKYAERAKLSNQFVSGHDDQSEKMKIMFQYANFVIQKYNEMVYVAMFLKNKISYNTNLLDQLDKLIGKY